MTRCTNLLTMWTAQSARGLNGSQAASWGTDETVAPGTSRLLNGLLLLGRLNDLSLSLPPHLVSVPFLVTRLLRPQTCLLLRTSFRLAQVQTIPQASRPMKDFRFAVRGIQNRAMSSSRWFEGQSTIGLTISSK